MESRSQVTLDSHLALSLVPLWSPLLNLQSSMLEIMVGNAISALECTRLLNELLRRSLWSPQCGVLCGLFYRKMNTHRTWHQSSPLFCKFRNCKVRMAHLLVRHSGLALQFGYTLDTQVSCAVDVSAEPSALRTVSRDYGA